MHGSAVVNAGSTQVGLPRLTTGAPAICLPSEVDAEQRARLQVLAVATAGNEMDGLLLDTLHGQEQKTFLAHYTCPSYAINEVPHCKLCRHHDTGLRQCKGHLVHVRPQPNVSGAQMKKRAWSAKRTETAGSRLLEAALAPVMPEQAGSHHLNFS